MSILLRLYRAAAALAAPLVRRHLARRAAAGKEDPARLGERFGHAGRPRPPGPLIWLHAASVGEATSVLPLAHVLVAQHPALHVLITTGTVTSAALLAQQLPAGLLHQFAPVDLPAAAAGFLDHWRPDLVLWTESEFWPNLIGEIARRKLPLVLVNGRMSERAFRRWRRFNAPFRQMLGAFSLCLAQTRQDAARLTALGAANVQFLGNLKFSTPPLPADAGELAALTAAVGRRPCWLAASTHPGEEAMVAEVHRRLAATLPDLLTLLVPRHPQRGPEIAALLEGLGLTCRRRGLGQGISPDTQVYLADTIGELGLWYRLAPVVFVGGSISVGGGHNPLEPARLGAAILHGPGMSSFAEIAADMTAAGASLVVSDATELAAAVGRLLSGDGVARRAMASAAGNYAGSQADTLSRILVAIAPLLCCAGIVDPPGRHHA